MSSGAIPSPEGSESETNDAGDAKGGGGNSCSETLLSALAPSVSIERLRQRGRLLRCVREFFEQRGVLEVETPLVCSAGVVDAHLDPVEMRLAAGTDAGRYFLMTSPELCMKRLLAAGSGAIYQLTRAFRDGERGRLHNPEFTILEWYRPWVDLHGLMDEVEGLVAAVYAAAGRSLTAKFDRHTYQSVFQESLDVDPLTASVGDLALVAAKRDLSPSPGMENAERDAWLNFLLATCIEPTLGVERPVFVSRYPVSQAALARVCPDDKRVADRVELYIDGVEIANGYHELTDPQEQRRRFAVANEERRAHGKRELPVDERFLRVLNRLPDCCGIAVGIDRLFLTALGGESLDDVMAFPIDHV